MLVGSKISCFLRLGHSGRGRLGRHYRATERPSYMAEPSGTESRNSRRVRVMLADNHTMFRQSVASMLAKDGDVEVVGDADNGVHAIDLAKETRPDVVI